MERRLRKHHNGAQERKREKWRMEEEQRGRHGDAASAAVAFHSLRQVPAAPAEHWSAPW